MLNKQLDEILSELKVIEFGDKEKLASLLKKTEVYIKKVFGEDSEYYDRYCRLSFLPEGVIYNTGHYKNKEAWDIGMENYFSLLETVGYEFDMKNLSSSRELEYPTQVTFHWVTAHVPIKIWLSFLSLLIVAFLSGVAASELGITKWFVPDNSASVQEHGNTKPNK